MPPAPPAGMCNTSCRSRWETDCRACSTIIPEACAGCIARGRTVRITGLRLVAADPGTGPGGTAGVLRHPGPGWHHRRRSRATPDRGPGADRLQIVERTESLSASHGHLLPVPAAGQVTLGIFNIAGQCVATLVNEAQRPGRHVVGWGDADRYAAGVYFYRLSYAGHTRTGKMQLVK